MQTRSPKLWLCKLTYFDFLRDRERDLKMLKLDKVVLLLSLIMLVSSSVLAQRPEPKKTEIQGHTMYTLLEPGGIPAIFEPEFVSVSEAESTYYADEPLLVVVRGDDARGYSTWHLDHHEIVNEQIGGAAIAVTW